MAGIVIAEPTRKWLPALVPAVGVLLSVVSVHGLLALMSGPLPAFPHF
ncbi:hypothetical protein L6Q21_15860 [Sandaracinobacter sp. RS1-74]|nr:hypothetical protein [Sandaracinobacteroides sayramensis]MCG2842453.1 hypothetical protein [Sandaracinobacteroides sayramensis]